MAHGQNAMIKREIDCVHHNSISVINKSSSLVGNSATVAATAAAAQPNVNDGSGATSHSGAGSARTGSRRIFTPQFKLQVLESYRNDSECKLNQRATARKYNIHRRQIQKWLQCEKSLRQSVANYSQNNVKHHQFHNITHHQMTISSTAATAIGAAAPTAAATTTQAPAIAQTATAVNTHTTSGAYAHHNNNNLHYHHHHRHSQPYKTALDPARHSVALASSPPTVRLNAVAAPTKCMNGLPLTQPGAPTNTMGLHPAYSQTPAIKPVPLIQPHHQHQSPLHQHHHPLHHSQTPHGQHENVLMSSACLPEPRAHEMLEHHPPMNVAGGCYENFHRPQAQHPFGYYRGYPGAPIDLSVGPRRPMEQVVEHQKGLIYYRSSQPAKTDVKWYQVPETNNNEQKVEVKVELHSPSSCSVPSRPISTEAVDLTCRKRPNHTPDPSSPPEKIPKTGFEVSAEKQEKAPTKPVKLFKPYLPDNGDPDDDKETKSEQKDAIIWSIHPAAASLSSPHYDMHSTHSCSSTTATAEPNFQSSSHQNDPTYTFPLGSPHSTTSSTGSKFQSSPASSLYDRITPPTSAQHPSSPASITGGVASSTTLHMWCPKGSPVSGYDTASNYSDSSERHPHHSHPKHHQSVAYDQCSVPSPTNATPGHTAAAASSPIATTAGRIATAYSLDVKMEPIEEGGSYYHDLTSGVRYPAGRHPSEVQRWLQDHEGSHLDHHSIPHQQHSRPGIAVYV